MTTFGRLWIGWGYFFFATDPLWGEGLKSRMTNRAWIMKYHSQYSGYWMECWINCFFLLLGSNLNGMTCHDRENMPLNMLLQRRFLFCNAILLCAQIKVYLSNWSWLYNCGYVINPGRCPPYRSAENSKKTHNPSRLCTIANNATRFQMLKNAHSEGICLYGENSRGIQPAPHISPTWSSVIVDWSFFFFFFDHAIVTHNRLESRPPLALPCLETLLAFDLSTTYVHSNGGANLSSKLEA